MDIFNQGQGWLTGLGSCKQSIRQIQACSSLWHSRHSRQAQAQPQAPPHMTLLVQVARVSKLRHSRRSRQAQAQPPAPPHMMLLVQVAHGSKIRHSRSHHGRKTLGRKMLGRAVGGQAQSKAPGQAQQAYRSRGLHAHGSGAGHDHDGLRHSGRTPRAGSEFRGCACSLQSTGPSERRGCSCVTQKTTTSWCRCSLCCQLCHVAHVCVEAISQTFSGSPTGLGGGRHAVQQLVLICTFVDISMDGLCGL